MIDTLVSKLSIRTSLRREELGSVEETLTKYEKYTVLIN